MAATLLQLSLSSVWTLYPPSDATASGYEECNQILTQDIFNKVTKSETSSASASEAYQSAYFKSDATSAYNEYKSAFDEAKKKGTKLSVGGNYGPIGAKMGLELTSETEVKKEEFEKAFNSVQRQESGSQSSSSSSAQSLVNTYATYVRDPGTVSAWKDCVTKTKETNLYAFASRDNAGKTYVNVIWVPGQLAGIVPAIHINFVTGDDDIKIAAKPEENLAMGSGRSFLVKCQNKSCDAGFLVTVNGSLNNTAGVASSFTTNVEVPPKLPPAVRNVSITQAVGTWEIHQTAGSTGEYLGTLTLNQEGGKLRGTLVWKTLEPAEIIDGQVSGQQLTIMVRYSKGGVEGTYVGTFESPSRLSGIARGQGSTVRWYAIRQ
jgi:hypothetical protein